MSKESQRNSESADRELKRGLTFGSGMVPDEGIEPPTFGLQNRCTTAVLIRPKLSYSRFARRWQRLCALKRR